jgi:hypothetical protein
MRWSFVAEIQLANADRHTGATTTVPQSARAAIPMSTRKESI